jgi:hypothetical protein
VVAGCSDDDAASTSVTTTPTASVDTVNAAPAEWVAVYAVEPYEDEWRSSFIAEADSAIFEGPANCFDGLATQLHVDGSDMVIGLVAETEPELEDAIGRVPGEAIVRAELPSNCND